MKSLLTQTNKELHSKIRDMNMSFDQLVIGSSLEALTYSFLNNIPIISCGLKPPLHFEHFDSKEDLSIFGIENTSRTIKTNYSKIKSADLKFDIPALKRDMESRTNTILAKTFKR